MTRLEQLHQFLQEDPTDPFNLYAIAVEYQKTDRKKARAFFEQLLTEHENYLPLYYTLGKFYLDEDEHALAVKTFEHGIQLARAQQQRKTQRELQSALDEAMFD